MKCPLCGAMTSVSETRQVAQGYVLYRRRVCDNSHRFGTHEVDDSLARTVARFAMRVDRIAAMVESALRWNRNASIAQRAAQGEKHAAIAADHNLSDNMISTIVRRHR